MTYSYVLFLFVYKRRCGLAAKVVSCVLTIYTGFVAVVAALLSQLPHTFFFFFFNIGAVLFILALPAPIVILVKCA